MTQIGQGSFSQVNPLYATESAPLSARAKVMAASSSPVSAFLTACIQRLAALLSKPASKAATPSTQTALATLNQTTNSRYNVGQLATRLLLQFKDPGKIEKALDHLLEHDIRFQPPGKGSGFSVDLEAIQAIRQQLQSSPLAKREKVDQRVAESPAVTKLLAMAATAQSESVGLDLNSDDIDEDDEASEGSDHSDIEESIGEPAHSLASSPHSVSSEGSDHFIDDPRSLSSSRSRSDSVVSGEVALTLKAQAPRAEVEASPAATPKALKAQIKANTKLAKKIAAELVGLVTRDEVTCRGITQTAGHIEYGRSGPTFKHGCTISAELQKKQMNIGELANHAILRDAEGHVVLSRSARSDTTAKIEAKSVADIEARLRDPSKKGLRMVSQEGGKTLYLYERSDVTLMDTSALKSLGTRLMSSVHSLVSQIKGKGATAIEDERAFVANKKKATDDLFKDAKLDPANGRPYIDREIKVGTETFTVREYKPLVFNFVFSGQAKSPANMKQARESNIDAAISLFQSYISSHTQLNLGETYNAELLAPANRNKLISTLTAEIKASPPGDRCLALKAILVALSGRCPVGDKIQDFDTPEGTHVQFMLMSHLSSALSVECKSGNDRTILATALACAQRELSRSSPFDPTEGISPELKDSFTSYLVGLGESNLVASRGLGEEGRAEVKIGGSPVYKLLTDDSHKKAIAARLEVTPTKPHKTSST